MSQDTMRLTGPYEKDAEHYLNPNDWYGDPVDMLTTQPANFPWGFGATCWYYRADVTNGDRLFIAAETANRALSAARGIADHEGYRLEATK